MSALARIFATKREEVRHAKSAHPLSELKSQEFDCPRGFKSALLNSPKPVALIAEVKKASPSQGLIRADFDPVQIARTYEQAGAACLSVLTDEQYFQGSAQNLMLARAATSLPVLRKDFIDDEYQVWEARAWGADAILLIVAALSDGQISELSKLAKELGMDVLVEVHDERETERALKLECDLIGVNNRNLADFTTDIAVSERLIPKIGPHAVAVSESALEKPEDIERVRRAGARAVLIGTSFCAAPDVGSKVMEVMGW